jgi:hypothetical protein
MKLYIIGLIGMLVVAGVAMSEMFPQQEKASETKSATGACVDFDPPDPTQSITLSGVKYNLTKKDAPISEEKVKGEMRQVGRVDDQNNGASSTTGEGSEIDTAGDIAAIRDGSTTNYFGDTIIPDIRYVLLKIEGERYFFNVYIKEGVALPDYIRNCKTEGGQLTAQSDPQNPFPPAGFNTSQVDNPVNLKSPAYVYMSKTITRNAMIALKGIQSAGSLTISGQQYALYYHLGTVYLLSGETAYKYNPTETELEFDTDSKDNLQLRNISFVQTAEYSWYTPECKPAIYLYPQSTMSVNVKVMPAGYFTYTDPIYPSGGWTVLANPSGTLHTNGRNYDYLYYESNIRSSLIEKPATGYVVKYSDLTPFYKTLLPSLGLNSTEQRDFIEYWEEVLPKAPYYFVGVMSDASIEKIEPMEIVPSPDSVLRVRLYFRALEEPISVTKPTLPSLPKRYGFSVVEWGGMVEPSSNTEFTCSQ